MVELIVPVRGSGKHRKGPVASKKLLQSVGSDCLCWDRYCRKQKRCPDCVTMNQAKLQMFLGQQSQTELGQALITAIHEEPVKELTKIFCTKILSRLRLREENANRIRGLQE